MRGSRILLIAALCLAMGLFCVSGAGAEERKALSPMGRGEMPGLCGFISPMEGRARPWWGVLYDGALYLARAEEESAETDTEPMDAEEVEFVWPLWNWLLCLLGFGEA